MLEFLIERVDFRGASGICWPNSFVHYTSITGLQQLDTSVGGEFGPNSRGSCCFLSDVFKLEWRVKVGTKIF